VTWTLLLMLANWAISHSWHLWWCAFFRRYLFQNWMWPGPYY